MGTEGQIRTLEADSKPQEDLFIIKTRAKVELFLIKIEQRL